jgi:hypothetical protein
LLTARSVANDSRKRERLTIPAGRRNRDARSHIPCRGSFRAAAIGP